MFINKHLIFMTIYLYCTLIIIILDLVLQYFYEIAIPAYFVEKQSLSVQGKI